MIAFFNTFFYEPLYNGLVFLISIMPGADVGLAVIVLTLLVKIIILPLSHKSVASQAKMRSIEPEMKRVKERHKDKQEQARQVMDLYKKHGVNPFSGCFLMLVQLPIIFALYWVFFKGLANNIDQNLLYSFITAPEQINMHFLGLVDMSKKNIILAALAGISQYFQMKLSMPPIPKDDGEKKKGDMSFKDEFAKNMNLQMRYMLPGIVFFVAYSISSAVALYWLVSNLFSIGHELVVKRKALRLIKA